MIELYAPYPRTHAETSDRTFYPIREDGTLSVMPFHVEELQRQGYLTVTRGQAPVPQEPIVLSQPTVLAPSEAQDELQPGSDTPEAGSFGDQ